MPDRRALQRAYVRAVVARLVAAPIISPAVETRLRAQVARLQAEEAQAKLEEARWHVGINRLLHAIYTPADAETPGQSPPKPPAVDEP